MARFRRRTRKKLYLTDVSLTPLIDTALTLLIIFMVTAHMFHNSILIQLPKGSVKEDREIRENIVVTIDKNGNIYLGKDKENKNSIIKKIELMLQNKPSKTVFVQGDQGVSYGKIIELVDLLKGCGGVEYVALSTEKASS